MLKRRYFMNLHTLTQTDFCWNVTVNVKCNTFEFIRLFSEYPITIWQNILEILLFSEDRSSRKICQKLITQDSFQSWGFLQVMTPNRRLLLELASGSHNQTNSVCQLKHTVMWMSSRYSSTIWGMRAACRMLSGLSSLWGERCQSSVSFIVDTVIKNAPWLRVAIPALQQQIVLQHKSTENYTSYYTRQLYNFGAVNISSGVLCSISQLTFGGRREEAIPKD